MIRTQIKLLIFFLILLTFDICMDIVCILSSDATSVFGYTTFKRSHFIIVIISLVVIFVLNIISCIFCIVHRKHTSNILFKSISIFIYCFHVCCFILIIVFFVILIIQEGGRWIFVLLKYLLLIHNKIPNCKFSFYIFNLFLNLSYQ